MFSLTEYIYLQLRVNLIAFLLKVATFSTKELQNSNQNTDDYFHCHCPTAIIYPHNLTN